MRWFGLRECSWTWVLALASLGVLAMAGAGCDSPSGGGGGNGSYTQAGGAGGTPTCRSKCPKSCTSDADCPISEGQICCSFNTFGSACVDAKDCPRFCDSDSKCDSSAGELCCRTSQFAPEKMCEEAKNCVSSCTGNDDCGEETVCCTSFAEPLCVKPEMCPKPCNDSQGCNTGDGEVCCFTGQDFLKATSDYSPFVAGGLCAPPEHFTCPVACTTSQQCPEQKPICCPTGFCDEKCDQPCSDNNDCNLSEGEFCCASQVLRSPWFDD